MENFDWTRFTRKIDIKAPLSIIYGAWTKASEIEKWFLMDAVFYDENGQGLPKESSVKAGNSYKWIWYVYDDIEKGQITEANGKDFIQFTFAGNCLVDIRLIETGDKVIVELTQKNIPTDDNSKKYIRLGCHAGWSFYLVNLKSICEGGIDLRNRDAELKGMLNV